MQTLGCHAWRPASSTAGRATPISRPTSRAPRTPTRSATSPATIGGGRHPLPSADAFAAWASAAGIGPETLVVAYDDGTGWAARLWWLLRHFGHDAAGVIRLDAWNGPLAAGEEKIAPATFVAAARGRTTPPTPPSSSAGSTTRR